jgi:hypothetical protein
VPGRVSFSLPAGNHSRLPFSVLLLVMSSRALAWLHDVVVRNRRPRGSCTAGFFGGWQQRSPPVARPMLLLLLLLLLCSGARAQQLSKTVNNSVELREAIEGVLHPQFPTGIETIWVAPGIYNYSDAHSDAALLNVQSEGYVYKCEVAALCIFSSSVRPANLTIRAIEPGTVVIDAQGSATDPRRAFLIFLPNPTDRVELRGLNVTGGERGRARAWHAVREPVVHTLHTHALHEHSRRHTRTRTHAIAQIALELPRARAPHLLPRAPEPQAPTDRAHVHSRAVLQGTSYHRMTSATRAQGSSPGISKILSSRASRSTVEEAG